MAENAKGGSTQTYTITRSRGREEGILQVPTADGEAKLVRLHGPVEVLIVDWEATRLGAPPIVPHPAEFENNLVFLRGSQGAIVPQPKISGGHVWSLKGQYVYALRAAKGLDSEIPTGRVPWENQAPNTNTIPVTALDKRLLS